MAIHIRQRHDKKETNKDRDARNSRRGEDGVAADVLAVVLTAGLAAGVDHRCVAGRAPWVVAVRVLLGALLNTHVRVVSQNTPGLSLVGTGVLLTSAPMFSVHASLGSVELMSGTGLVEETWELWVSLQKRLPKPILPDCGAVPPNVPGEFGPSALVAHLAQPIEHPWDHQRQAWPSASARRPRSQPSLPLPLPFVHYARKPSVSVEVHAPRSGIGEKTRG